MSKKTQKLSKWDILSIFRKIRYNNSYTDMRRLVLMAVMALFPVILSAQVKHGSEFEVGAGVSIYGITGSVGGLSRNAGPTAYLGYGYRFHDNFDALFRASYKNGNVKGWTQHSENPTYVNAKCNQVEGMLGVDYVILPSKLVRPFVGAGIGSGVLFEKMENTSYSNAYGIVGPHFGVSIWRFRLSVDLCYAFDAEYGFESDMSSKTFTLGFLF